MILAYKHDKYYNSVLFLAICSWIKHSLISHPMSWWKEGGFFQVFLSSKLVSCRMFLFWDYRPDWIFFISRPQDFSYLCLKAQDFWIRTHLIPLKIHVWGTRVWAGEWTKTYMYLFILSWYYDNEIEGKPTIFLFHENQTGNW